MIKTVEIDLLFQPYIPTPPESPQDLYARACSSDRITVETWKAQWISQAKENHEKFGPFHKKGLGLLHNKLKNLPCIVVGSGPSLKNNVDKLKDTKGIPVISCLHNYQFLEDRGIKPDYYVSLDAGEVTIQEVSEGGIKTEEEYFESTKNKVLLAHISSHPKLISKWKGEVYWFSGPMPDQGLVDAINEIEVFNTLVSPGGNVLGACFYIAKAIMGSNPIIFVGADFSFSYTNKFHAWDSKYDKSLGQYMRVTDIFGNSVKTWQSYYNFKCWFESRVCAVPGLYINATEGGILGSYPQGNIQQIQQMALGDVIKMYSLSEECADQCKEPQTAEKKLLF